MVSMPRQIVNRCSYGRVIGKGQKDTLTPAVMHWEVPWFKRGPGHPCTNWRSTVNKYLLRTGITWQEVEVAAQNRSEWRRSVAQCIHLDVGWIKVKVKVKAKAVMANKEVLACPSGLFQSLWWNTARFSYLPNSPRPWVELTTCWILLTFLSNAQQPQVPFLNDGGALFTALHDWTHADTNWWHIQDWKKPRFFRNKSF